MKSLNKHPSELMVPGTINLENKFKFHITASKQLYIINGVIIRVFAENFIVDRGSI